ncbi:MAG TPA: KUP/HAK/KT family potassium transporter, partial [Chryseolinea sp.]
MEKSKGDQNKLSFARVIVVLGIIYGDIGTSPIYTLNFIVGDKLITDQLVFGAISCVFWTLTLITTIKYIYLALNADNRGEGGIFALYALVRRHKAGWVIYPAMIGCCTLIADGFITPAISVSSAIEGIRLIYPQVPTTAIVIVILLSLFVFQQFGSALVSKTFGPIMAVWFLMLAVLGSAYIVRDPSILMAINPVYAIDLLTNYPGGFILLGGVFLCTTGAEALYSDLGQSGKSTLRLSWSGVKVCLLLNYFGQGAWLLSHRGESLGDHIPFFSL